MAHCRTSIKSHVVKNRRKSEPGAPLWAEFNPCPVRNGSSSAWWGGEERRRAVEPTQCEVNVRHKAAARQTHRVQVRRHEFRSQWTARGYLHLPFRISWSAGPTVGPTTTDWYNAIISATPGLLHRTWSGTVIDDFTLVRGFWLRERLVFRERPCLSCHKTTRSERLLAKWAGL